MLLGSGRQSACLHLPRSNMIPVRVKEQGKAWPWGEATPLAVAVPRKSLWAPLPDSLKSYPTPPDLTIPPPFSKAAFPPLPISTPAPKVCPSAFPSPAPASNFDITAEQPCKDIDASVSTLNSTERYMSEFFTKRCEGRCPGIACIFTHRSEQIRRKPHRLSTGYFNYTNIKCQRNGCNLLDCPFAHTSEEVLYHPEQYKTTFCVYGVGQTGVCVGFGVHCPFAHSERELRKAAPFNSTNDQERKPELLSPESQSKWSLQHEQCCKGPSDKPASLNITTYKTSACHRSACKASMCPNYHTAFDRRRSPKLFSYLSVPCKFAFDLSQRKYTRPDKCPQGDNCRFAHTKYESYYHPQFYKTQLCCYYATSGVCKRGSLCAYVHDGKETATPRQECSLEMVTALMSSNQQLAKETGSLKCQVEAMKCAIKSLTSKLTCPACNSHERGIFLTCGDSVCQSCSHDMHETCPLCLKAVNVVGAIRL